MLSEMFYWLLSMSISASIAGAIVCLLSRIRKIPRRILCALWIVPFLRMWIPFGLNSQYSLMSLISKLTTKTVTLYEGAADISMVNFVMAADTYFPVTYTIDPLETVFQIAAVLWLIIAAALILTITIVYVAAKAELKGAHPLRDRIFLSDKVTSPATYGIVRPKILLPHTYETKDLTFILLHEEAHIKRGDNLWRILAILTACIHWFNPLSWLFLKRFLASVELACDETVLKLCGESEKKNYAMTLLHSAESKSLCTSAFGGANVRLRIEHILSYKKLSALSIIAFSILAVFVGYILLTNAV